MSLEDYKVEDDRFEYDEKGQMFCFPCCVCKHRLKSNYQLPCAYCQHNDLTIDDEEKGDK